MAITYERSYKASDGKCYSTLAEAQTVEIAALLGEPIKAADIVEDKDAILAILTLNDSSRPKARGVPKKRKPKVDQPELPKVA